MKPILFLDVDGVLNALGSEGSPWEDGYAIDVFSRSGWAGPRSYTIQTSFKLGEELEKLPVDIVWLTTWMHEANNAIAPVVFGEAKQWQVAGQLAWGGRNWKLDAIVDFVEDNPDHPFIWIDDDAVDYASIKWCSENVTAPFIPIKPDCSTGITHEDIDKIWDWIHLHSFYPEVEVSPKGYTCKSLSDDSNASL